MKELKKLHNKCHKKISGVDKILVSQFIYCGLYLCAFASTKIAPTRNCIMRIVDDAVFITMRIWKNAELHLALLPRRAFAA